MTIPTTVSGEKPKEAQVLINPETVVKVEFKQAQRDATVKQQHKVHAAISDLIQRRRRRYVVMNIAVAIASLLVVVAGICGGIYVYKWITHSNRMAMQGSCTVPYHEDSQAQALMQRRGGMRNDESRRMSDPPMFRPRESAGRGWQPYGRFVEKYNVLNAEQEVLQVPQPGANAFDMMPINIIHDFSAKLTAIVDVSNGRCFVKPLDPNVVPPRDFIDLLRRIEDGSYVPNVCLIRKHYRAQQPPLDTVGLAALRSDVVSRSCALYATYQLVRIDATTTALPPATTRRMMLLGGDHDYAPRRIQPEPAYEPEDSEPSVRQEAIIPDETDSENQQERVKRSVDQLESQVAEKSLEQDEGDLVFNVGFGGSESVELAMIQFEETPAEY